ncbi:MAG TPA: TatD family hydrolase, partial [Devosia sp.]|nr:TatD family hydrolase [Devosia sp.]
MLIDSHCHLDFEVLANDIDGVLARAAAVGVSGMVTISTLVDKFSTVAA